MRFSADLWRHGAGSVSGLVYVFDSETESTPVYWLGIVLAAFSVTLLPLFFLTLPASSDLDQVVPISVSFNVSFPDIPEVQIVLPKEELPPEKKEAPVLEVPQAKPEEPKKPEPPALAIIPPEKPKEKLPAAPRESAKNEPAASAKKIEPKPLHDRDLQPMIPVDIAYDQSSKITKAPPKDGNLSDRNSNAADRGPKTLKIGEPYMDKGETNLIKYAGKRGEGNLPPVPADANSGSVKKEGSPVSGDGSAPIAPDFSSSVKSAEKVRPPEKPEANGNDLDSQIEKKAVPAPPPPPEKKPIPPPAPKAVPPNIEPEIAEVGSNLSTSKPKRISNEVLQVPTSLELNPEIKTKPAEVVEPPKVDPNATPSALAEKRVAISKALDAQAELAAFEAQLNGANTQAAGTGSIGKTGPKVREGTQGHEGNGTLRPGDDEAVSDVTTINLQSSATEFGDPRFEKRYDAKTAYIRKFARLIDNKWKADIQAKLRVRLVPGMVSIRVILGKDGKLIEASEAFRNRGVTDEYVATAKHAVEEAAEPKFAAFPADLSGRETIEYTFNFLYQ